MEEQLQNTTVSNTEYRDHQRKSTTSAAQSSPATPKHFRKGLIITTENTTETDTGGSSPKISSSTPRFHRKQNVNYELQCPSPAATTPKQSWFQNLFKFKQETVHMLYQGELDNLMAKLNIVLDVN
jgi:hypothetical protein